MFYQTFIKALPGPFTTCSKNAKTRSFFRNVIDTILNFSMKPPTGYLLSIMFPSTTTLPFLRVLITHSFPLIHSLIFLEFVWWDYFSLLSPENLVCKVFVIYKLKLSFNTFFQKNNSVNLLCWRDIGWQHIQ